jgi:GNAT superfamily N-acetyltransferase
VSDPFSSLIIRPGEPGDFARVQSDWKLSFATSDFARFCTPRPDWEKRASELYWSWASEIITRLLRDAELWVASWAEDVSAIVGWCVLEPRAELGPVVHYVNVPPPYRNHGVAKRLLAPALEHATVTYTHRTRICRHLPIPPGWKYDPRLALAPRRKETAA